MVRSYYRPVESLVQPCRHLRIQHQLNVVLKERMLNILKTTLDNFIRSYHKKFHVTLSFIQGRSVQKNNFLWKQKDKTRIKSKKISSASFHILLEKYHFSQVTQSAFLHINYSELCFIVILSIKDVCMFVYFLRPFQQYFKFQYKTPFFCHKLPNYHPGIKARTERLLD